MISPLPSPRHLKMSPSISRLGPRRVSMDVARPGVDPRRRSSSTQGLILVQPLLNRKLAMDGSSAAGPSATFCAASRILENSSHRPSRTVASAPCLQVSALCPLLAARPSSPAGAESMSSRVQLGPGPAKRHRRPKTLLLEEGPAERSPPRRRADAEGRSPANPAVGCLGRPRAFAASASRQLSP